jgi:thioredoxin 2
LTEKVRVSCLNCGVTNNFPLEAVGRVIVCGRCRTPLPVPGKVLELSDEQAYRLLNSGRLPILFDFYTNSCLACQAMHPILERLAMRRAGELMVAKLNAETHPELASRMGIQGVPTFIVFYKAVERGRVSGAMGETDFSLWVASLT